MSGQPEYKVALDVYSGPLDLLLYLIRREEVDIHDIPIARITEQYLAYVELIQSLDAETASDFLLLAATLMEIKSRTLLPHPPAEEIDDELIDPRLELVHQLLEYKKYKDAAMALETSATERAMRYARPAIEPPQPEDVELEHVEVWDLFEAFKRILEQTGHGAQAVHRVEIDDTPISLHEDDILDSLRRAGGTQPFEVIFAGRSRGEMIGLFLALLELIRQRMVRAIQDTSFSAIQLFLMEQADEEAPHYAEEEEEHRRHLAADGQQTPDEQVQEPHDDALETTE